MAEILLSLTIIGVVAAITLPGLTGNINERTWNTQRKALYARMSQAISLMPSLNGYGTYSTGNESTSTVDTAAETFVTEGLSKVLKINNICDVDHLNDCGIPDKFTNLLGESKNMPTKLSELNSLFTTTVGWGNYINPLYQIDTKFAAFETQNGESILVAYNPFCVADGSNLVAVNNAGGIEVYYTQPYMCANFIYDLNGNKGPNTVGKDIGWVTVMYSTDSVVTSPMPVVNPNFSEVTIDNARNVCTNQNAESRIPNIDELASMFYNKELIGSTVSSLGFWSNTLNKPNEIWNLNFAGGCRGIAYENARHSVYCIKR